MGAGLGFQVRRVPGPTQLGPPPRGARQSGRGVEGGPGPRASRVGRRGLRPGPPASPWISSFRLSGRKTPVESATGNFSLPDPPAVAEFGFRVCTTVLALGSRETGAPPGWLRGTPRAETEFPATGPTCKTPGQGGGRRASPAALPPQAVAGERYVDGLAPVPAIWALSLPAFCAS